MSDPPRERRRHARAATAARIELIVAGTPQAARMSDGNDLSAGGMFVLCDDPPPLHARVVVRVLDDEGRGASVDARVVRVRWGGRDRGLPAPPGVALAFDAQEEAAAALARLLEFSTRGSR